MPAEPLYVVHHQYRAPVDAVYRVSSDPDHVRDRLEKDGACDIDVTCTREDGRVVIASTAIAGSLPALMRKFLRAGMPVSSTIAWSKKTAAGGSGYHADYQIVVGNQRVVIDGTIALRPTETGSEQVETYSIRANVPLFRARLTRAVADRMQIAIREHLPLLDGIALSRTARNDQVESATR